MIYPVEIVRNRPKRDTSTKEWEIQKKVYFFNIYTKKLTRGYPWHSVQWSHWRYYTSSDKCEQAIKEFRKPNYNRWLNDFSEDKSKHFLMLTRYRIIKRKLIKK